MSINVEAHGQRLTCLNIELRDAIGAKDLEDTLLGILLKRLNNIACTLPL